MLELDQIKLRERVDAAYAALLERTEELARVSDSGSLEERQVLADALHGLRTLEKLELGSSAESRRQSPHPACGEPS